MKILAISHEYPPIGGGGANACYFLTKGFVEYGHEVTLITANYRNMPEKECINGVNVLRVNAKRSNREHCNFVEMLDFLRKAMHLASKEVNSGSFDICFTFFGIPSGPIGYILKRKYHIPYVIRFGGGDIPGFQERFKKVYWILGPFIKCIWRNADALVMNSEGLKRMACKFYNKPSFLTICNGVDTELFTPNPTYTENKDTFTILFVSRLIERKGLQHFIPQLKEIQSKVNKKVQLRIVGDGPYRLELEKIVNDNQVGEWVTFEGQKNRKELPDYYRQADLFILPSAKEGMPNVVLEAMASGLPIIMTPCEGSEELIDGNGFVVERDKFADKIIELLGDEKLLKEMSERSREIVEEKFMWNNMVEAYLNIFSDIIDK